MDGRQGRQNGPVIDGAAPARLLFDPPPEPSLYFVDTVANGVYQYSLRLIFQRQYRPLNLLAGQISALAIGPGKEVYIAVENNVFYSGR
ncbi:MAG: hypothetical protein HY784_08780 [Chloroflexi bacterium]|nr:hypothetical protein [Chloroflexota bacterium]